MHLHPASQPPQAGVVPSVDRSHRPYLHGVQGLRTVAALMVAIYHIWFDRVSGGVDVFFVVAAFFATNSLLRLGAEPRLRKRLMAIGQYWLRTARRIIPSTVVVVVSTVIAGLLLLPRSRWDATLPHGWASLFFFENWYLITAGENYLQQGLTSSPFQQFWALAIQAQVYLLLPVLAMGATALARCVPLTFRGTLLACSLVVLTTSLTFSIHLTKDNQAAAYFHLGTRLWEFMVGIILALILTRLVVNTVVARWLGWAGLAAIVMFGALFDASLHLPGVVALIPVLAGAAIIVAAKSSVAPRVLSQKPLLWFADSSFAFYLWHWPILILYRWHLQTETVSLPAGTLILLLSALLAVLTTYLVEKPMRVMKIFTGSALASLLACGMLLMAGATALALWEAKNTAEQEAEWQAVEAVLAGEPVPLGEFVPATGIAAQDLSEAYDRTCLSSVSTPARLLICDWGIPDSEVKIALVGASHDAQWTDLLAETAIQLDAHLFTILKASCPFGDTSAASFDVAESCPEWGEMLLDYLLEAPPDLVITMATRVVDGREIIPDWKLSYFERLSDAGIPVLAVRDNPRMGFRVPECIDARGVEGCSVPRSEVLSPIEELNIPSLEHFHFLDTADDYCEETLCPAVRDGILLLWDNGHLTRTWTMVNGDTMRNAVIGILDGPGD